MKLKQHHFFRSCTLLLFAVLTSLIWSCGSDDNEPPPPPPPPEAVTASFTASQPQISMDGNTATVTYTNTSTGTPDSFLWNFGTGATPPAVEVDDDTAQTVEYELADMESTVTVTLEARDASDTLLDSASEDVNLPALIASESISAPPAREPCSLTFQEDPGCFCSDPANADNPLCASVATNGDLEATELSTNFVDGFAAGGGWDLRSTRGFGSASTMTRVEENGNNFLEIAVSSIPTSDVFGDPNNNDAPWVMQTVSEPLNDMGENADEGWPVMGGQAASYVVLLDVYAETAGARVSFTPEVACGPCGAVDGSDSGDPNGPAAITLEQGWNQLTLQFDNTAVNGVSGATGAPLYTTVRGNVNWNFPENVGVRLALDNYRLIPIDVMPPDDDGGPTEGVQVNPVTFDVGGEPTFTFSFAGASANEVVVNPFPGGANPEENNVLQITNEGVETFDGHGWGLPAGSELDFTGENKVVRALVYSEEAIGVRLQVQGGIDDALILRTGAAHTGSGWEAVDFDFNNAEISGDGGQMNAGDIVAADGIYAESIITIGPDVQSPGTFFVDNIGLIDETPPEQVNLLTFDAGGEPSFTFSFAGASTNEVVVNPFPGGANPDANNVLQIINEGVETFDGHGWGFPAGLELDFSGTNKVLRALVYSEEAIGVRFQVQGGANDALILRASAAHTGSGWEAIDFDFNTAEISGDGGQANAGDIVAADGIYAESIITVGPDVQSPGTFFLDNIGILAE